MIMLLAGGNSKYTLWRTDRVEHTLGNRGAQGKQSILYHTRVPSHLSSQAPLFKSRSDSLKGS